MHIVEVLAWSNDGGKVDHVIDNVLRLLHSNNVGNSEEVRKVLLSVGKRMGVKSLKRLFDRFHQRIERGDIPREYGFYSGIALRNNDPRVVGVREDLEIVLEVFNSPYKFTKQESNEKTHRYMFELDDGTEVKVNFARSPREDKWQMDFNRNISGDYDNYFDDGDEFALTGEGDAFRLFATILEILRDFVNRVRPHIVHFSADDREPSRIKLYDRMIKRFTNKMGYRLSSRTNSIAGIEYTLGRIA